MKQKLLNKKWLWSVFFVLFILLTQDTYAQSIRRQCISSYGSSVVTENVLIGATAGQSFNTDVSYSSTGTTISQGFQQPNIFTLKEIGVPALNNLNILIFPNPASHSITITSEEEIEQTIIQVTDINGKYLLTEKVTNLFSHNMNCASWANGVYLITISDSGKNTKTLRLIISK